jgi:hypothetical protein
MAEELRISVTFSAEAAQWLRQQADRRATSLADMIRRIIDEARGAYLFDRRSGRWHSQDG